MGLSETLEACGYSVRVVPNDYYWDMTVHTVGTKQSLPPAHALAGLEENYSTSGLDEQQQVERGLADSWTHEGLLLGILLSNRNLTHRTTMCARVLFALACYSYAFLFVWWAFYEYVDKSRVTLANRVF